MTISNHAPIMSNSIIIQFPVKINFDELSRSLIRQLYEIEGIEDYNSFKKSLNTSYRAKNLFLILLKDRSAGFDFFGKYCAYLNNSNEKTKNSLFQYIESADVDTLNDINNEIEEVSQFRPKYYYHHIPYDTNFVKKCIKEYSDLMSRYEKEELILKEKYEEIILENLFEGALHGLSDKISNLFEDELGRSQ